MFSKLTEITGLATIAVAVAFWATWEAGLLLWGLSLLFVGTSVNDAAVSASLRKGFGWFRYAWYRQILRENGIRPPKIRGTGLPEGWVACGCDGQEECPVCDGTGAIPDPKIHTNPRSPHPPIRVDPEAEAFSRGVVQARLARSRERNGNYERIA